MTAHHVGQLWKNILLSVASTAIILFSMEILARAYFCIKYSNFYFYATYGFKKEPANNAPASGAAAAAGSNTVTGTNNEAKSGEAAGAQDLIIYEDVKHERFGSGYGSYYKSVPGVYRHRYKNADFDVRINKLGFRGKDFSAVKNEDVFMIFCLGSSSTQGLEVEDGKDYPSCLQKELSGYFPDMKFEVVNAGFLGYDSATVYNLFAKEVSGYSPDMVVIYEGFNNYHTMIDRAPNRAQQFFMRYLPKIHNFLYTKSVFFLILHEKLTIYTKKIYPVSDIDDTISSYEESTQKTLDLARDRKIAPILVKQAVYIKGHPMEEDADTAGAIRKNIDSGKPLTRDEIYLYMRYAFNRKIEGLARRNSVMLVDAHAGFSGRSTGPLFNDSIHLKEGGDALLADIIARDIRPVIAERVKQGLIKRY